jgi:nitrogen regulatory protein PII
VRLEIAVSDHEVDTTIEAIRASARTGQIGDGKIFVLPVERAMRVRTGETGDEAL